MNKINIRNGVINTDAAEFTIESNSAIVINSNLYTNF